MRSLWASLPHWVNGELELLQFHNLKHHTLGLIRERDRNGAINLMTSIIFLFWNVSSSVIDHFHGVCFLSNLYKGKRTFDKLGKNLP